VPALRRRLLVLLRRQLQERNRQRQLEAEAVLARLRAQLERQGVRPGPLTRADLSQTAGKLPKAIRQRSRPAVVRPESEQQI
jgi:hypothetical protein